MFKKSLVCLDFGFNEIRLLQLKKKAGGFHIEKMLAQPLPGQSGTSVCWQENTETLHALVKQENLRGHPAAFALPASAAMKKQIEMPSLPADTLESELRQNFSRYFPDLAEKEVYFDFVAKPLNEEQLSILLVAARKGPLEQVMQLAEQSGLKARMADLDLYALARGASFYFYPELARKKQLAAVFNLGWPIFSLIVFTSEDLVFHYQWCCDREVFEKPLHFVDSLVLKLQTAWQLCLATHPKLKIDLLGLSGELKYLKELASVFQKRLSREIKMIDPFFAMTHSAQLGREDIAQLAPSFLLCCGLALHGQHDA